MPEKDGLETLTELRKEQNPPKTIIITGGGMISSALYIDLASSLGADSILEKPIKRNTLLAEVNRLLPPAP